MVFRKNKVVIGANTVVFGENTVVFGANAMVFRAYTVVFWGNAVEFGANIVAFEPNTVVSGQWWFVLRKKTQKKLFKRQRNKNQNEIKLHSFQKPRAEPKRKYEKVNFKPNKNRNSIKNNNLLV